MEIVFNKEQSSLINPVKGLLKFLDSHRWEFQKLTKHSCTLRVYDEYFDNAYCVVKLSLGTGSLNSPLDWSKIPFQSFERLEFVLKTCASGFIYAYQDHIFHYDGAFNGFLAQGLLPDFRMDEIHLEEVEVFTTRGEELEFLDDLIYHLEELDDALPEKDKDGNQIFPKYEYRCEILKKWFK